MTYDEFIQKHVGKAIDYDGTAGVQCVDLAKAYLKEVFEVIPGAWGNAHCYYDNFNSIAALKSKFKRVLNTPDYVPKRGVIAVWKKCTSLPYGHIAICAGEGNKQYFYSYDQNWGGKSCAKIKHDYSNIAGFLEPVDRSGIDGVSVSFSSGVYTLKTAVKVRNGAGVSYSQKKRSELTANGKANSISQTYAVLKSGTVVTVYEVKKISDKEYWGRIPSGWIALMYDSQAFVQKKQ